MGKSKKRKYVRKSPKRYEMVSFECPLFEGEFVLPNLKHMNMKVSNAVDRGDFIAFAKWLESTGVDKEAIEVIGELDREEIPQFMEAWSDGVVTIPKSEGS